MSQRYAIALIAGFTLCALAIQPATAAPSAQPRSETTPSVMQHANGHPTDESTPREQAPPAPRAAAPTGDINMGCGLRNDGCVAWGPGRLYYASKVSRAAYVQGAIMERYGQLGWENGFLGYPTRSEDCSLTRSGCWNPFQNGAIYFTPNIGARFIRGAIRDKWGSIGYEWGKFGYPVTDENCGIRDSGCFQHFERENGSIYWSPQTGAHTVQGLIKDRWAQLGWENSELGYPTSDEFPVPGGVQQNFQGGWLAWLGGDVYGEPWVQGASAAFGTKPAPPDIQHMAQSHREHRTTHPSRPPATPASLPFSYEWECYDGNTGELTTYFANKPSYPVSGRTIANVWITPLHCGDDNGGFNHILLRHGPRGDATRWTSVTDLPDSLWEVVFDLSTAIALADPWNDPVPAPGNKSIYISRARIHRAPASFTVRTVVSNNNNGQVITSFPENIRFN